MIIISNGANKYFTMNDSYAKISCENMEHEFRMIKQNVKYMYELGDYEIVA